MCMGPDTPPTPAPLPVQPPPVAPVLENSTGSATTSAIAASKGRSSLRIDKTQNVPGSAGSGLNIPS